MEPSAVQGLVTSLRELYNKGKPDTDEEVRQRLNEYFEFCERSSIRPDIESACMALHVGRTAFFNWSKGVGCSEKRREYIEEAKGFISAYIEQALLSGKISPPSGIFLAKNWLGYRDSVSIEEATVIPVMKQSLTPDEIAAKYDTYIECIKRIYTKRQGSMPCQLCVFIKVLICIKPVD